MKTICIIILTLSASCFLLSCSKSYNCTCDLWDTKAGIENGSRMIVMESKSLNAKKRSEKKCDEYEKELNTGDQTASCRLK